MAAQNPMFDPKQQKSSSAAPILRLAGGLRRFLSPRRAPPTGYSAGEPRFARVRRIVKSDVAFENGLGGRSPGSHVLWGHSGAAAAGEVTLSLGDFLSPN
ncbi:MAG: hypothetical protein EA352_01805 [Gemmatimonadales bacterium]|nr:MAG: hypothetical protein EA352_01805 [Gemmatimonadales bacterium]